MVRWLVRILVALFVVAFLFIAGTNILVIQSTKSDIYNSEDIPYNRVGLVLGTSNKLVTGEDNPYFFNRISTAASLLEQGKLDHLILSGDNETIYYNEPATMRNEIKKLGVADSSVTLDYAGFRTLDSVVRCKEVFGQEKVTIVTQKFHAYRALYISNFYGIDAVAVQAEGVSVPGSLKVQFREMFARPKAVLDLYIFKKSPKFLGKKESV